MATVTVVGDRVEVRFTGWERLWTGRRQLTVPLGAVRQADLVDEPLRLARGARRGITVSGLLKIGVWGLFGGTRQLVAARSGEPGLHLVLDRAAGGGEFDEIVVSGPGMADAITPVVPA